jgi:hypothetical protein
VTPPGYILYLLAVGVLILLAVWLPLALSAHSSDRGRSFHAMVGAYST